MIIGTGIDIVNIERIERMMDRWGNHFIQRVFTAEEIISCQKRSRPSECFATRFAAKEAFVKSLGSGLRNGMRWTDIAVANDAKGRPSLSFRGKAKEIVDSLRIRRSLVTLSHDHPYAVAHVLLEGIDHEGCDR